MSESNPAVTTVTKPEPATEAEPVGKWVGGHWVVDPCWTGAK